MRNIRNTKGFTLIELMIVVVIIGILAAIAIPKFSSVSDNAKQAEAEPILKQICSLAEAYQQKEGVNATNIDALVPVGWSAPTGKYFDGWKYTPGTVPAVGSATAALTTAGTRLKIPIMDCDTKKITFGTATAPAA